MVGKLTDNPQFKGLIPAAFGISEKCQKKSNDEARNCKN